MESDGGPWEWWDHLFGIAHVNNKAERDKGEGVGGNYVVVRGRSKCHTKFPNPDFCPIVHDNPLAPVNK